MTAMEGAALPNAAYRTLFQEGQPWFGGFDVQADMAIAYRVSNSLRDRLAGWKAHGYRAGLMTGLAVGPLRVVSFGQVGWARSSG